MFLLFFDDVSSERELMRFIAERLDYMSFLGYGLDDEISNHSVLSKARARWGVEVFETVHPAAGSSMQTGGPDGGQEAAHGRQFGRCPCIKQRRAEGMPGANRATRCLDVTLIRSGDRSGFEPLP